jgi:hypothetical protein
MESENNITIAPVSDVAVTVDIDGSVIDVTIGEIKTIEVEMFGVRIASISHLDLKDLQLAGPNVVWGHINNITQTIEGKKTFSTLPVGPAALPNTDYELANKKYVDDYVLPDPLTSNLLSCPEVGPAIIDGSAGGVIDIDFAAGQYQIIEIGTVDITFTFSNFPAGKAAPVTVELKFLGASIPNFTYPALVTGLANPDFSSATTLTGRGLLEMFKNTADEFWALAVGII